MKRDWIVFHIYEWQSVESFRKLVKKHYNSTFRINEFRFSTRELRSRFQSELLNKFVDEYKKSDLVHNFDSLRLYTIAQEKWFTPYGDIVLNDLETMQENGVS